MSKKYGKKCPWKNSNRWKKRRETPKRNPFWQLWSVDKARSMQNLVHFSEDQKHCVMACVFEKWLCLPTAKDSNQFFDHMKYFQRELAPCCSFKHFLNLNIIKHIFAETTSIIRIAFEKACGCVSEKKRIRGHILILKKFLIIFKKCHLY